MQGLRTTFHALAIEPGWAAYFKKNCIVFAVFLGLGAGGLEAFSLHFFEMRFSRIFVGGISPQFHVGGISRDFLLGISGILGDFP